MTRHLRTKGTVLALNQGSAVVGFCFLTVSLLLGGSLALFIYHWGEKNSLVEKRRADGLQKISDQTQGLNRIATNNILSILEISRALEDHLENTLQAIAYQQTVPFWLAAPSAEDLPENEPVSAFFAKASKGFALALQTAFAHSQDSVRVWQSLSQAAPLWAQSLKISDPSLAVCLALFHLQQKEKTPLLVALEKGTGLRTNFEVGNTCSLGLGESPIFSDSALLEFAAGDSQQLPFLLLLEDPSVLCQSLPAEERDLEKSPWRMLFGVNTHKVQLREERVALSHPRIHNPCTEHEGVRALGRRPFSLGNKPSADLRPLLEPRWVPVAVLSEGSR